MEKSWQSVFVNGQARIEEVASVVACGLPQEEWPFLTNEVALRYALGRGPDEARVSLESFTTFYGVFGPPSKGSCITTVVENLFFKGGPVSWFHAFIGREQAEGLVERSESGSFLIRYSSQPGALSVSYNLKGKVKHTLILLDPSTGPGVRLAKGDHQWNTLLDFIQDHAATFFRPIQSSISIECSRGMSCIELQRRLGQARGVAGEGHYDSAMQIAEELICKIGGGGSISPRGGAYILNVAKLYKLYADVLLAIRENRDGGGVSTLKKIKEAYKRSIELSEKGLIHSYLTDYDDDPETALDPLESTFSVKLGFAPLLSQAHDSLANIIFSDPSANSQEGLYHVSQVLANTPDIESRGLIRSRWHSSPSFRESLEAEGWNYDSVLAQLEEGGLLYKKTKYKEALSVFDEVMMQARCLGLSFLECRALGNAGLVHRTFKDYARVLQLYSSCLNLLAHLDEKNTYFKIMNSAIITLEDAGKYHWALKYNLKLLYIAESGENRHLLEVRSQRIRERLACMESSHHDG